MKKFKQNYTAFLVAIATMFTSNLMSQNVWECGYDSAKAEVELMSPDYVQSQIDFNQEWVSRMTPGGNNLLGGGAALDRRTIPVVVHVVYNILDAGNLAFNVSADQIRSQIAK